MRPYLEPNLVRSIVAEFFAPDRPTGSIRHGVLSAAHSRRIDQQSVLYGKKTAALTKFMEPTAWALTCLYLGNHYRTYSTTVDDQVRSVLATDEDFIRGPVALVRDSPSHLSAGFTRSA